MNKQVYPNRINQICRVLISVLFITAFSQTKSFAWGFWAHKQINKLAVFTLPDKMSLFYKSNINYITQRAVAPDQRRYVDEKEAPRHYIDLDHYGKYPYDTLPHNWYKAVERFSEDTLNAYGIVPWHVNLIYLRLIDAFKTKDADRILFLSADLGHYIADAHVPLHATENYNGQLTGQVGIHAFWESRIPELLNKDWDYFVGQSQFIDSPQAFIWRAVLSSGNAVDSVLGFEKELNKSFPEDKKYGWVIKGNKTIKDYSENYAKSYNNMLNGMVERRMRESILAVGSFWYTAWMMAGQPDLDKLVSQSNNVEEKNENVDENSSWKGRKED